MITVLKNKLEVSVEKKNGSRIRTISLKENESNLPPSSMAATLTPFKTKDNDSWIRQFNSTMAQNSNIR